MTFLKVVQSRIEALPYPVGHVLTFLWMLIFIFVAGSLVALGMTLLLLPGVFLLSLFECGRLMC
jgi:hypothetical protein